MKFRVFLYRHRLIRCLFTALFPGVFLICVLLSLSSCAPAGRSQLVSAGEPKNSYPFFDKDLAAGLHSIAVPPFLGDQHNWHGAAIEVLSSSKRISVTPSGKINDTIKNSKEDLSLMRPEKRLSYISGLCRTMHTDAVMNGVILNKQGHIEIILQIISSGSSRVIWWQAVDVSFSEGALSRSEQQKVLSSLLAPFLALAGKKEPPAQPVLKQETVPPSAPVPKTEAPTRIEKPPVIKPVQKSDKKPLKEPSQEPEDISPM